MKHTKRGLLASAVALVGAAALALGGAAAAQAAPTLDPADTGSITIHKFETPEDAGAVVNDGALQAVPQGWAPIPGVAYRVERVDLDVTTNAGMLEAAAMTPAEAAGRLDGAFAPRTGTTGDPSGELLIDDLPLGQYLVSETSTVAGGALGAPFLVTIPLVDPGDADAWLTDVHVYPKNAVVGATKGGDASQLRSVGDTITWTIKADIPKVVNPGFDEQAAPSIGNTRYLAPKMFEITDPLIAELSYAGHEIRVAGVTLESGDYTVATGQTVTLAFTADGLQKLALAATLDFTAQVEFELATTLNAAPADGVITNQAIVQVDPDAPATETTPEEGGDDATAIVLRDLRAKKVSNDDARTGLAGAAFAVFATEAEARSAIDSGVLTGAIDWTGQDRPVAERTVTSGAGGELVIAALAAQSGGGADVSPSRDYWLVETAAPAGHQKLAEPVRVTLHSDDSRNAEIEIVNINLEDAPGFALPITGGTGTALLTVGGIALLALVLLAARRRRSEAAAE